MEAIMQKALSLHCMFRVMLKPSLRRDNVSKRASDSRVILYPRTVEGHRNNGIGNEGNGFLPEASGMSCSWSRYRGPPWLANQSSL